VHAKNSGAAISRSNASSPQSMMRLNDTALC
jgi:hypothetical protein